MEAIIFWEGFLAEVSVLDGEARLTGWGGWRLPSGAGPGPSAQRGWGGVGGWERAATRTEHVSVPGSSPVLRPR